MTTYVVKYSTWAYHGGKLILREKTFASEEARARFIDDGLASGRVVQVLDMVDLQAWPAKPVKGRRRRNGRPA